MDMIKLLDIICFNLSEFFLWFAEQMFYLTVTRFEEVVRESHGELSILSGGEKHGYDVYPREW